MTAVQCVARKSAAKKVADKMASMCGAEWKPFVYQSDGHGWMSRIDSKEWSVLRWTPDGKGIYTATLTAMSEVGVQWSESGDTVTEAIENTIACA